MFSQLIYIQLYLYIEFSLSHRLGVREGRYKTFKLLYRPAGASRVVDQRKLTSRERLETDSHMQALSDSYALVDHNCKIQKERFKARSSLKPLILASFAYSRLISLMQIIQVEKCLQPYSFRPIMISCRLWLISCLAKPHLFCY